MIRVFPKRTKWTPTDDLAFIGEPGLFRPPEMPVKISCAFTWHIAECLRLERSWKRFYRDVKVGGPAFGDHGGEFIPGRFLKPGITITSRGCTKDCKWCLVPSREGYIRELPIREGNDVADNNLLACSEKHILNVFDMLRRQPEPIRFSGGLDAEMFHGWHSELIRSVRLKFAWFACDYPGAIENLKKVANLLSDINREKKRCYVLIGFNGETIDQARKRLESVYLLNFLPMAMFYRDNSISKSNITEDWRRLIKTWSRPAAYKAKMKRMEV